MNKPQVYFQLSAMHAVHLHQATFAITLPLMCSATKQWPWHIGGCSSFTNGKPFTVQQSYVTATKELFAPFVILDH